MNARTKDLETDFCAQIGVKHIDPFPKFDVWVLLWSQSQNALHVEPIARMMSSNRRAYGEDRQMDYVPVYIGEETAARQLAEAVRCTLHARELTRAERPRALL